MLKNRIRRKEETLRKDGERAKEDMEEEENKRKRENEREWEVRKLEEEKIKVNLIKEVWKQNGRWKKSKVLKGEVK